MNDPVISETTGEVGMRDALMRFFEESMERVRTLSVRAWFVVAEMGGLAIVWPLPHTIALRNALMVVLFATLFSRTSWKVAGKLAWGPLRGVSVFYISFTLWILVGAIFVSPFQQWSLSEVRGQWLAGFAALLIGVAAALQKDPRLASAIVAVFLSILVVQVAAVDIQGLWVLAHSGAWSHMARVGGLTAGPGKASYLTNFLLSSLVAELSLRMEGRRSQAWSSWRLGALLFLCFVSIYVESMRNEIFDIGVFTGFVGVVGYRTQHGLAARRTLWLLAGSVTVVAVMAGLDLALDPRWQTLWATIPVALDTSRHLAWLNAQRYPLPHLPNGQVVNASNYLRVAWIKEGLKCVIEHPLGVGYGRSAFGHALRLRFGHAATTMGLNNSLLTVAIGTGIPGTLLWLGWFWSMARFSLSRITAAHAFAARFSLLIVLAFGIRMCLDNVMQNYTLEEFMLFIGLLFPLSLGADAPYREMRSYERGRDSDANNPEPRTPVSKSR